MPDDMDLQDLEDQEWPEPTEKGGRIEHTFMDGTTMAFKIQDPEAESIMAFIGPNMDDKSQSQRQYEFVSAAVVAPQIPIERWRGWREADRMALTSKVSEVIGLDRIVDFRADDLDDLMSSSPPE
jgi:hypothetical protein